MGKITDFFNLKEKDRNIESAKNLEKVIGNTKQNNDTENTTNVLQKIRRKM